VTTSPPGLNHIRAVLGGPRRAVPRDRRRHRLLLSPGHPAATLTSGFHWAFWVNGLTSRPRCPSPSCSSGAKNWPRPWWPQRKPSA